MSIVTTQPVTRRLSLELHRLPEMFSGVLLSALLTPLSLLILGYHPFAEDGGLYLAGVKYLLNPALYPHSRSFVTAPLTYSVFAPWLAFVIRHGGLPFNQGVFACFVACLFATIFAAWCIARVCFVSVLEQSGATLLVALWLGLPVAGTSLMLIDPYLTARSVSTPFVLLALAEALRATAGRRTGTRSGVTSAFALALLYIALAAAFHPLMAGYGAAFILAAVWMETRPFRSKLLQAMSLGAAGIACAAGIQAYSPVQPASITSVSLTRSYWFLARWEWFEVLGLIAPLLLLLVLARSERLKPFNALARTAVVLGVTTIVISLCFARPSLHSFGVSHLQPLRIFQLIYFALFIGLGASLARLLLRSIWWRWSLAVVLLGAPVVISARIIFPSSAHIEWPQDTLVSTNKWVQAFQWIQRNTPADALFALDANYISDPREDAQSFRAIAERSSLPDYSKDGGETAVNPFLIDEWVRGVKAQTNLSSESDLARDEALQGLGVTWIVLKNKAVTSLHCPYDNGTVKVCERGGGAGRLP